MKKASGMSTDAPAGLRYEELDRKIGESLDQIAKTGRSLAQLESSLRTARALFRDGARTSDWPREATAEAWHDARDRLLELHQALCELRKEGFRAAVHEDGLSFTDLAAHTGLTRQVVTRLVKGAEPRLTPDRRWS